MNYTLRKGLNVPVVTALDETGRVIEAEQRRIIRHVVQDGYGADVIFGVGTTGEWNRMDNAERQRAMQIEVDEVRRINEELAALCDLSPAAPLAPHSVEFWTGVNGSTQAELLANLDAAIQLGADAAVIAPLAVADLTEREMVHFFQRDVTGLLEASRRQLPIFLYDNADINAPGQPAHIRTRIVKQLSRLPWLAGIKVSAPRRVLGNYTKAALHFKQPGEFGIYVGNAMLIFEWFRPERGLLGRLREGWRDYLLYDALPIGVVAGPANVMPREWQKAWRVCWAGDEELMNVYHGLCDGFESICVFDEGGRRVTKKLACLKYALELDGVIATSLVGRGTPALSAGERQQFAARYQALRERIGQAAAPRWQTTHSAAQIPAARLR